MNQHPPADPTDNGQATPVEASTFDARVAAICMQVAALDQEIAMLEQAVAPLPGVLAALARHPVLWLLIGREGIDRPGSLGTIVGQQVVTVVHHDRTTLLVVGIVMLMLGVLCGSGGALLWIGVLP